MEKIKYLNPKISDVSLIRELEERVWGNNAASTENIRTRVEIFPTGNVIAVVGGKVVGFVSTVIINKNTERISKTWYDYTDNGNIKGVFDKDGEVLFGVSLTVDNNYGNRGIGTNLLLNVGRMAIENNLEYGILGGRLPFYHKRRDLLVEDYASLKDDKDRIFDPELRLYLRMGLKVVKFQPDYFKDADSLNYGVILRWNNPFFWLTRRIPCLCKPLSYLFKI